MSDLGPIAQQAVDILSTICASLLIGFMILYLIYLAVSYIKTKNAREDYIKTLKEHDKAVIKDYENCEWNLGKKKK